jgi:hypothetical protein
MAHYDTIVIGAGLAGLAAAIRTAHFGKSVRLFETHTAIGGLNSWYKRNGRVIDVGLHALTNFVPESDRSAPLNRILRQLRIKRSELELVPQDHSDIVFPDNTLRLNNDFEAFRAQIAEQFPDDIDGFDELVKVVRAQAYSGEPLPYSSTQVELSEYIMDQRLIDMLCMPVMYYGNPCEEDMDFQPFCTMFQSILIEGFARPRHGMKQFLEVLQTHLEQEGGELTLGCRIRKVTTSGGRVCGVIDENGEEYTADAIVAAVDAIEVAHLIGRENLEPSNPFFSLLANWEDTLEYLPRHSFVEGIFELPRPVRDYGLTASVTFLCNAEDFQYFAPESFNSPFEHILVCAPGNYPGCDEEANILRLSGMTDADEWIHAIPREEYLAQKQTVAKGLKKALAKRYPKLAADAKYLDLFTPHTIAHFTDKMRGGIYGGRVKFKDFQTGYPNMLIAGTDQGLLGIVGAMLSGIIAANTLMK